jgi:phosphoenolpyruvate-protein kinase (PTS system EI component)
MRNRFYKALTIYVCSIVLTCMHIAPGMCFSGSALRPVAAAHHNVISIGLTGDTQGKTSSAGMDVLHGDARLHKTVRAQAARIEILATGQPILRFPVSARDAKKEIQRFHTIISTMATHFHSRPAGMPQALAVEAQRILKKHVEQLDATAERAQQALDGTADPGSKETVLAQSPVNALRDILNFDIAQYEALNEQLSANAARLLVDLLNGEESGDEPLILYNDPHSPTKAELDELAQRAAQESARFQAVLAADIERRNTQIAQYYNSADNNMRKLRAFISAANTLYNGQLKRLLLAGAELYAVASKDAASGALDTKALDNIHNHIESLSKGIESLANYSQAYHDALDAPDKAAAYQRLGAELAQEIVVLRDALDAPGAEAVVAAVFNESTRVAHKALLSKIRHRLETIASLSLSINNALASAQAAGPFVDIVQAVGDKITSNALASANSTAEKLLLQDSGYRFFKRKLQDPALDSHTRVTFQDTVGAIDNLVYSLRATRNKLQHPLRTSTQPIVLVLSKVISLDQFTDILSRYAIAGVLTTHGTLAEHQPITASGSNIPWVRITDAVDLDELIEIGQELIIEARTVEGQSRVVLKPSAQDTQQARSREHFEALESAYYNKHAAEPALAQGTGLALGIRGNSAGIEETYNARIAGADGIGLFRSELLVSAYEALLEPYVNELRALHEQGKQDAHASLRLQREILFFQLRADVLNIFQVSDLDKPFVFRLFDLKIGDKGDTLLTLLSKAEQGNSFEDNALSAVRTDIMTLLTEALLDAMFIMRRGNTRFDIIPMFPEINNAQQIRWFFESVWPQAIKNQQSRIMHENMLATFEATPEAKALTEITQQMHFAVMAERLGINEALEDILREFPRITTVSVGTNDYTEDLLNAELSQYGVQASRSDPHFEKSFFELEPEVLRHIVDLAETINRINSLRVRDKVTLGVCGDIAGRYEFVVFMLWLKARYADNVPMYVSVVPGKIGDIKSFVRITDPGNDFAVHAEPIFDGLLGPDTIHIAAIESLATQTVQNILHRYEGLTEYQDMVLKPQALYRAQLASAEDVHSSEQTTGKSSSAGAQSSPSARAVTGHTHNIFRSMLTSA